MSVCRIEEMQTSMKGNSSKNSYDLEDYIYEMESRQMTQDSGCPEDVYSQLAQKEKDLILAAELGKALLDRNEELSRANERVTEDYTKKLELLEQEKHALKRKLENIEGEYESRIMELQSDIKKLCDEIDQNQGLLKTADRERSGIINELTEQNIRLTSQLKQVNKSEGNLNTQLNSLREQFNLRRSNLHDHVTQLEMLREEINVLTDKKAELERRIETLIDEREAMQGMMDEMQERILYRERIGHEQEMKLRSQTRDLDEMREVNSHLQARLDTVLQRTSTPSNCSTSLFNEIEMSSQASSSVDDDITSINGHNMTRNGMNSFHDVNLDEDHIECEDLMPYNMFLQNLQNDDSNKMKEDLLDVYHQLQRLCDDVRCRRNSVSSDSGAASPIELQPQDFKVNMLTSIIKELKGLLRDIVKKDGHKKCNDCVNEKANQQIEKLQMDIHNMNEQLRKRTDCLSNLTSKLSIQETELAAIKEERDMLRQDVNDSSLAKDEIVKRAWDTRDKAVGRKNATEISLAKTRIDVMHINSQLMEAIQQKIELSQQLEQWQVDMQALLEERVQNMLQRDESKSRPKSANKNHSRTNSDSSQRSGSKLFSLWR